MAKEFGEINMDKHYDDAEVMVHSIEKQEDGTYKVDAMVRIYLKSKECQKDHSYDASLVIDILEDVELDEDSTGDKFTIQ